MFYKIKQKEWWGLLVLLVVLVAVYDIGYFGKGLDVEFGVDFCWEIDLVICYDYGDGFDGFEVFCWVIWDQEEIGDFVWFDGIEIIFCVEIVGYLLVVLVEDFGWCYVDILVQFEFVMQGE